MRDNGEFQSTVRAAYCSLESIQDKTASRGNNTFKTTKNGKKLPTLKPINHVPNFELNIAAPPHPFVLLEIYGDIQFYDVLNTYTLPKLREAAKFVEQQAPGVKIIKTNKDALITSMVEQITHSKV